MGIFAKTGRTKKKKKVILQNQKAQKKKKPVIKTILENSSTYCWPDVEGEVEEEIIAQIKQCCFQLKLPAHKPPWKEIQKLHGEERIQFCQEYKKKMLKKLSSDPDASKRYESAKEARSHLILGYNAVMRALEQNRLAGLIIEKAVYPPILAQTFAKGCNYRNIPIFPYSGLHHLLKREDTLGVKHSVMVLGLKTSVKEVSCRFHPLYVSILKILAGKYNQEKDANVENVLGYEVILENKESAMEDIHKSEKDFVGFDKENCQEISEENKSCLERTLKADDGFISFGQEEGKKSNVTADVEATKSEESRVKEYGTLTSEYQLTPSEITSYHLKRTDSSKRIFIPKKKKTDIISFDEDVMVFQTQTLRNVTDSQKAPCKKDVTSTKKRTTGVANQKNSDVDDSFNIFFDTAGKEETHQKVKDSSENLGDIMVGDTPLGAISYKPAKTRRIKSNPNKKRKLLQLKEEDFV